MNRIFAAFIFLFSSITPVASQSLNSAAQYACSLHQPLRLNGDHVISEPLTEGCDGLIIDLGGATITYIGGQTDTVVDIKPKPNEAWRVNTRVQNGTIRSNGNANFALRTFAVSHSIFDNLRLRDVKISGYIGFLGIVNRYQMISCSANEKPFTTIPQSCFITNTDGSEFGFGIWASHLETIIAEGLSGIGVSLSVSSYNVLTAGTSEGNAVGININGDGNIINNFDLESNSIANKTGDLVGRGNVFNGFPSTFP
jgi:hypothetical protein